MAKECMVAKWESVAPLEARLVEIEQFSYTFRTMVIPAYDWAIKQLKKYSNKIGANIIAIKEERFSADSREYTASGIFYRLVE